MKILILTEAGKDIGFGHLTRSVSLYQAFKDKGADSRIIINASGNLHGLFKGNDFQVFNWMKEQGKLFKIIKEVDLVIIDSYMADKLLYDSISKRTHGRLVMLDDNCRLSYPSGMVINPAVYGDRLRYPKKNGIIYLLGRTFVILRKEFWSVPKKIINKEVKTILVTFGGTDYSIWAKRLTSYIKNKFCFKVNIVNPQKKRFSSKEMLRLMFKADVCISGGGQTIYELTRCGVPTIGVCFAENQRFNLMSLLKAGSLEFAGWYNDKDYFMNIENSLKRLDYKRRVKMSRVGQGLVDGQGARRIIEEIQNWLSTN